MVAALSTALGTLMGLFTASLFLTLNCQSDVDCGERGRCRWMVTRHGLGRRCLLPPKTRFEALPPVTSPTNALIFVPEVVVVAPRCGWPELCLNVNYCSEGQTCVTFDELVGSTRQRIFVCTSPTPPPVNLTTTTTTPTPEPRRHNPHAPLPSTALLMFMVVLMGGMALLGVHQQNKINSRMVFHHHFTLFDEEESESDEKTAPAASDTTAASL